MEISARAARIFPRWKIERPNVSRDPAWAAVTPAWSRDGRRLVFATVRRNTAVKGGWSGEAGLPHAQRDDLGEDLLLVGLQCAYSWDRTNY